MEEKLTPKQRGSAQVYLKIKNYILTSSLHIKFNMG